MPSVNPEYNPTRPKHWCHRCGEELVAKEIDIFYMTKTGRKMCTLEWSCPNRGFWKNLNRHWYKTHTWFESFDYYDVK